MFRDKELFLAICVAFCWLVQGTSQANFSSSASLPSFDAQFPMLDTINKSLTPGEKSHHSTLQGTTVAIYEVGCALGALSCFLIGEKLGRRRTIWLAGTVILIGIVIQSTSFSLAQVIVGRVVAGLGVGAFTATGPMWVGESVSPKRRGTLVLICGSLAILSIAVMSWINLGLYLHQKHNSVSWRFPIALPAFYTMVVMTATIFLPESPRWLVKKGRNDEAYAILRDLRGHDCEEEFEEILVAHRNELAVHDKSPFKRNQHKQLQRTILAISFNGLAQMSGINVATFYEAEILQEFFNPVQSRIFTAGLQTWQALWAFSAIFWIRRFGRRQLAITSALVIMCAMCFKAGLTSRPDNLNLSKAEVAFDFFVMAAFPVGLFTIPFMYAGEIAGLEVRHKVTAMGTCANWLFNFLVAEITPIAVNSIHYRYYIVYIATNALTAVFVYLFLPETKGRTLEEIDQIFINSRNIFDTVRCGKAIASAAHVPPEDFSKEGKPEDEMIEYAISDHNETSKNISSSAAETSSAAESHNDSHIV